MKPSIGLFAVLLATPALCADLLVVDASGGSDFTSLAAAVAAAANGDTLLVRDGEHVGADVSLGTGRVLTLLDAGF